MVQRRKSQARITKTSEPNKERLITRDVSVEPELPDTERTEGATKSSRIEKSAPPKRNYSTSRARHTRRMTDASSREVPVWHRGCVATFKKQQESDWLGRPGSVSCSHLEQLVDELNLSLNIRTAYPRSDGGTKIFTALPVICPGVNRKEPFFNPTRRRTRYRGKCRLLPADQQFLANLRHFRILAERNDESGYTKNWRWRLQRPTKLSWLIPCSTTPLPL